MHLHAATLAASLFVASTACGAPPSQPSEVNQESEQPQAAAQGVTPRAIGKQVDGPVQITAIVRRVFEDSRGHLWIGSNDEGLYRYDGSALTWFSTGDGLAGYQITGILEDAQGRIWLSTNGGVSRFDGRAFVNFTSQDGLRTDRVWSLFQDRDGTIWAGTAAGLCRFDGDRFVPFALPTVEGAEAPGVVWCTAQDRDGALWFGTDRGVRMLADGKLRALAATGGPGNDRVGSIAFDREHRAWIATMNSGLFRYDGRAFLRFQAPDDIGDNEVWFTYEDRQGHIWFNAEGFGIYRWDGAALRNFASAEGLGALAVQSVLRDRDGRFWAGGANGLYRLDGERFVHVTRDGPWK